MKSENAEGVFSDSQAINLHPRSQGPLFSSVEKVPWLRLFTCLCIQIKSALIVGHRLNFINSKVQFYLGKEEPNGDHVLSRLQFLFYLFIYLFCN